MSHEQEAPETKGVTVQLLATVGLGVANILQGTITDHRGGIATAYGAGVGRRRYPSALAGAHGVVLLIVR